MESSSAPMWLEIAKIAVPAVVGSAATGFYFNMRLKRAGSFEEATKLLLDRMIQGGAAVAAALDELNGTMSDICDAAKRGDAASAEKRAGDYSTAKRRFLNELLAHRVYVTELIPYGQSETIEGPIDEFEYYMTQYCDDPTKRTYEGVDIADHLTEHFTDFQRFRTSLRSRIDSVRHDILNGRVPNVSERKSWYVF